MKNKLIRNLTLLLLMLVSLVSLSGCGDYTIEQTKVGRAYLTTGLLNLWQGKTGFDGEIQGPGTYFAGPYTDVRKVNCEECTNKETLSSLTKDNIQFKIDVYLRQSVNCNSKDAIIYLLNKIKPADRYLNKNGDPEDNSIADGVTIINTQVYETYIRSALGEAMRLAVSPYNANDVLANREKIYAETVKQFNLSISSLKPQVVTIYDLKLSNFDPPDQLESANVDLAKQAILTQRATAEALTVVEQQKTAKARQSLAEAEAGVEVARIEKLSSALRANPEYFKYLQLQQAPSIYEKAGVQGNMILLPSPNATVMVNGGAPKPVVEPKK